MKANSSENLFLKNQTFRNKSEERPSPAEQLAPQTPRMLLGAQQCLQDSSLTTVSGGILNKESYESPVFTYYSSRRHRTKMSAVITVSGFSNFTLKWQNKQTKKLIGICYIIFKCISSSKYQLGFLACWYGLKSKLKKQNRNSHYGSGETNLTSILEDVGLIPGLAQWVKGSGVAVSCGVGCRRGLDVGLLWLWCRPSATARIWPLTWELPYAVGAAPKRQNNNNKKQNSLILKHNMAHFSVFSYHTPAQLNVIEPK